MSSSNRFLSSGEEVTAATLTADNLLPNMPIKTDSNRLLQSRLLDISDTKNLTSRLAQLQSAVDAVESDPLKLDLAGGTMTGPINNLRTQDVSIRLGNGAGQFNQGVEAFALGSGAGQNDQGEGSVAIGDRSGSNGQGRYCVALGSTSAIGFPANPTAYQKDFSVAIGAESAQYNQGSGCVSIGYGAAKGTFDAIFGQGDNSIAIGSESAQNRQGNNSIAIGYGAAKGDVNGTAKQGDNAIAIGRTAGEDGQGFGAVSIGFLAGNINQGQNSIAVGTNAGRNNQADNTIVISSKGAEVTTAVPGRIILESSTTRLIADDNVFTYNGSEVLTGPERSLQNAYETGGQIQLTTSTSPVVISNTTGSIKFAAGETGVGISLLDMNDTNIIQVSDPVNPQDAATKSYVDTSRNSFFSVRSTDNMQPSESGLALGNVIPWFFVQSTTWTTTVNGSFQVLPLTGGAMVVQYTGSTSAFFKLSASWSWQKPDGVNGDDLYAVSFSKFLNGVNSPDPLPNLKIESMLKDLDDKYPRAAALTSIVEMNPGEQLFMIGSCVDKDSRVPVQEPALFCCIQWDLTQLTT